MSAYSLAEMLHKFLWEVEQLPSSEYMGWIAYFDEKERKKEVEKGNLMAMNEDEIARHFSDAGTV